MDREDGGLLNDVPEGIFLGMGMMFWIVWITQWGKGRRRSPGFIILAGFVKTHRTLGGGGIGGVPAAFRLFFLVPKS